MNKHDSTANLKEQVEELRLLYVASFAAKSVDIAVAWSEADSDTLDTQAIGKLASWLHQLAGSAGSYGFTEIGKLSSETETLLKLALDAGSPGWQAARRESSTRITRLLELLQKQPA